MWEALLLFGALVVFGTPILIYTAVFIAFLVWLAVELVCTVALYLWIFTREISASPSRGSA